MPRSSSSSSSSSSPSAAPVPVRGLVDVECVARRGSWGEGVSMAADAAAYCATQPWCHAVRRVLWGVALPPVFGAYLCELTTTPRGTSMPWMWATAGTLPKTLFFVDGATSTVGATARYCTLVQQWIHAVEAREPLDGVFPLNAEPTPETADELQRWIDTLRAVALDDDQQERLSTSANAPRRATKVRRGRVPQRVQPGLLVTDDLGRDGVVAEQSPCPDDEWFASRGNRRLLRHRDAQWWRLFTCSGTARVAPEPALTITGAPTRMQHAIVWRNANDIVQRRVEALLGEPPF